MRLSPTQKDVLARLDHYGTDGADIRSRMRCSYPTLLALLRGNYIEPVAYGIYLSGRGHNDFSDVYRITDAGREAIGRKVGA